MKKRGIIFLTAVSFFFLLLPGVSLAIILNLEYPDIAGFDLNVQHDNLDEVIAWIYYFVVTISGLAVFAMLVWGGFSWMTSTGDPAKIADAKERIYSAFLGLIIILASVLIMLAINPELSVLTVPELPADCEEDIANAQCIAIAQFNNAPDQCLNSYCPNYGCDSGECCCVSSP